MSNHYGKDPETSAPDGSHVHGYPKVFPPPGYHPEEIGEPDVQDGEKKPNRKLFDRGRLVVQEKMDGGNFRVMLGDDETRWYGSKKTILGDEPSEFNKFFIRPATYIEENVSYEDQQRVYDDYGDLTVFGENMIRHSLDYDWSSVPPVLVFDVYVHETEEYLPLDEAKTVAERLGLEFVPVLEIIEDVDSFDPNSYADELPESEFRDGLAEGVVLKNYETQCFGKIVAEENQEVHYNRWGYNQKYADTYTELVAAKYFTNERIEKHIRKLVMEKGSLDMSLLPDLYERVYNDVFAEHWREIVNPKHREDLEDDGKTINFEELQSLSIDRCKARLKAAVDNKNLIQESDEDLDDAEYAEYLATIE